MNTQGQKPGLLPSGVASLVLTSSAIYFHLHREGPADPAYHCRIYWPASQEWQG